MPSIQIHFPATTKAQLSLGALLTAALLTNLFPLDIPLIFLYLPASLFIFITYRLFGVAWGAVCALLAATMVPFSVGHAYAIVWYLLEYSFVAWSDYGKQRQNLILSDALYWIFLGSPLVLLSFLFLGVNLEVGLLISAKNCVNGIANATLASLLLQNLPLRRWLLGESEDPRTPVSDQIYSLLLGFLILPALVMLIAHLLGSVASLESRIAQQLTEKANSLNAEFMLLAGVQKQGADANRSSLVEQMQQHWQRQAKGKGLWTLTLLNYDKVLLSTSAHHDPGDKYDHVTNAELIPVTAEVTHRIPHAANSNVPIAARWRNSSYLHFRNLDIVPGWRLVVEQPVKPFLSDLRWTAIRTFGLLVILLYPALYLARLVSQRIASPLTKLSLLTKGLPERLRQGVNEQLWPSSRIDEIEDLIDNCRLMSQSLQLTFSDLQQAQQSLEDRVLKRTEELAIANQNLRENESHLDHLAHHDPLTDLPNRLLFKDRLEHAIANAKRNSTKVALLFLDLDRFKTINDSLGHNCGDRLLCEIAGRLQACCRGSDTVARLGGDEFILLLESVSSRAQITAVAEKVLKQVALPVAVEGHKLSTTTSIGISLWPNDAEEAEALMKAADAAMYRAKEMGRGSYQFYTADMDARAHELLLLESSLRQALEQEQILLHYQPQIELASGRLIGFEALIRWDHPEHGLLLPNAFIPLAEETGLIEPIGEWVIETACRQNKIWQDCGYPPVRMAVNISARQFRHSDLLEWIQTALQQTGLAANWLELELTESMVMGNTESAILIMQALKNLGVHLAIDDFGSGYSSLAYLKRFPISKLKIAQAFISDLLDDNNDAAIAASVIALAQSMNLEVIAEGIENSAQLELLAQKGCQQGQGYYFSKPLSTEAVPNYFAALAAGEKKSREIS